MKKNPYCPRRRGKNVIREKEREREGGVGGVELPRTSQPNPPAASRQRPSENPFEPIDRDCEPILCRCASLGILRARTNHGVKASVRGIRDTVGFPLFNIPLDDIGQVFFCAPPPFCGIGVSSVLANLNQFVSRGPIRNCLTWIPLEKRKQKLRGR